MNECEGCMLRCNKSLAHAFAHVYEQTCALKLSTMLVCITTFVRVGRFDIAGETAST